jgi:50S ribosomal protein L16 3-hydroxylase
MSERRRTPPIEVRGRPGQPLGMPPAQFLKRYWQKHPLLVRDAFPGFAPPLDGDDLAGLACEEIALSRLVVHDRAADGWQVRSGPFAEADFATLPARDWTLLVQDCDKLIGEVEELLRPFAFLPDWRIDDVMVSYAAPGGSVGAHVDQYDVFLLQGHGHRRWQIDTDPAAPLGFREDVELKLLARFDPNHDWVLAPGDMLYLPPRVPHFGEAVDECTTWSIGLRAPAVGEMLVDFAEQIAERLGEDRRYADPDLAPAADAAEIDPRAIARVRRLLREANTLDDDALAALFARFITRYRSAQLPAPPPRAVDAAGLRDALARGKALYRSPWSRYAWQREGRGARLWFAGDGHAGTLRIARTLQDHRRLDAATLGKVSPSEASLLATLHNAGHLVIDDA